MACPQRDDWNHKVGPTSGANDGRNGGEGRHQTTKRLALRGRFFVAFTVIHQGVISILDSARVKGTTGNYEMIILLLCDATGVGNGLEHSLLLGFRGLREETLTSSFLAPHKVAPDGDLKVASSACVFDWSDFDVLESVFDQLLRGVIMTPVTSASTILNGDRNTACSANGDRNTVCSANGTIHLFLDTWLSFTEEALASCLLAPHKLALHLDLKVAGLTLVLDGNNFRVRKFLLD